MNLPNTVAFPQADLLVLGRRRQFANAAEEAGTLPLLAQYVADRTLPRDFQIENI
jgi:hypothetical protein